jgi:hypothetical protein
MAAAAMVAGGDGLDVEHGDGRAGLTDAEEMMAALRTDTEAKWAAMAVANAGIADDKDAELLGYNGESEPPTDSELLSSWLGTTGFGGTCCGRA